MSTPAIHQIVLSMQTALRAIQQSSGYNYSILSTSVLVDPSNIVTAPLTETPVMVLGHRIEPVDRDFKGTKPTSVQDRWRITIEAIVDVENDLDDNSKKMAARFRLAQDVEKALTQDLQRGGLALYTYVMQDSAYPDVDSQNRFYMEIPVEVLMQRTYGIL